MRGSWARRIAAAFFALMVSGVSLPSAASDAVITLESGHSTILQTPGLSRVAVGDAKIAGAVPIGISEVVINAKGPGRTSVYVWSADGQRQYEVIVSPQPLNDVASMLRTAIDTPGVRVVDFGHGIVVQGQVDDNERLAHITDVVLRFKKLSETEGSTIVNAVTVKRPFGELQSQLAMLPGVARVRLDGDEQGNVIVSGRVHDQAQAELVVARAKGLAGPYLPAAGKVIDRLEVETNSQIDIKVYVLEIDHTGLSQLGVRLQSAIQNPNNPNEYIYQDPNFPIIENTKPAATGKALNIGAFFRLTYLAPTLDLIERSGHARELSSPDLVTLPGNQAKFLVGGQIPYVYSTGLGQSSVIFKDYGVQLTVTPTILSNGSVESKIHPLVSDLDYQNAVTIPGGGLVPALRTSEVDTDVVTSSGQGIIVGGLLKHMDQENLDKLPGLGNVPVLGPLFRSRRYQSQDTDVVFVVVPEVITL